MPGNARTSIVYFPIFSGYCHQAHVGSITLLQQNLNLCGSAMQADLYNDYKVVVHREQVCRYIWHSVGSLGWPFPLVKY